MERLGTGFRRCDEIAVIPAEAGIQQ